MSLSSESSAEAGGVPLHDRIKIVSQQSTARPGAVIQLHAIADATHDWHNTQLLHVFQEQLITGRVYCLTHYMFTPALLLCNNETKFFFYTAQLMVIDYRSLYPAIPEASQELKHRTLLTTKT